MQKDDDFFQSSFEEGIILTIYEYGLKGERSVVKPVFGWMQMLKAKKDEFV